MTTTVPEAAFDTSRVEAFGERMMSILGNAMLSSMVDIGHRTGLFMAAAEGPATSEQLAARPGLTERYVREWLGAVTTGGIFEYTAVDDSYVLSPEHAAVLTGPTGIGPLAVANTLLSKHTHQVIRAFREGGGVPYAAYAPSSRTPWTRSAAVNSTPARRG